MTIPSGNLTYMAPVFGEVLLGASMGPIPELGTLVGHRQSLQAILKSWLCPVMTLVGRWDPYDDFCVICVRQSALNG
jgi:hypothetical protein